MQVLDGLNFFLLDFEFASSASMSELVSKLGNHKWK